MADEAVARRMFDARQALESKERARLTLDELGRRIAAAEEGRDDGEPYAPAVVKRWLEGDAEPRTMATWRAIAAVFGVRVGWLANGELPMRDEEGGQGARATNGDPKPRPTNHHRFVETPVEVQTYRRTKGKPVTKKPGRSAVA